MATYDDDWFEVWHTGEEAPPAYLLLVVSNKGANGIIRVLDPFKNNEQVFASAEYEEVTDWLGEDEYELLEGRFFPDDGWQT